MKIRSITSFADPGWPLDDQLLKQVSNVSRRAQTMLEDAGYEVQTTRLATPPFPQLFSKLNTAERITAAQTLEKTAADLGFAYIALGPAGFDQPEAYTQIPEMIAQTENVFFSAHMGLPGRGVSVPAVKACAEIIAKLAPQDPNGFANLYFTALANVGPGSPFFPAAYHSGGVPGFAFATEAASLAVTAFEKANSFEEGLANLKNTLETHGQMLSNIGERLAAESSKRYLGIDFSLAPYPEQASSLGFALEQMGVPQTGLHGSLAAAALLASTLDQANFKRVGFSGLLFPQLEDATLAIRAAEGVLSVKDLLMYSAVCGTGLDTIALPGDTTPDRLTPLLLDLAALALRLDKPLTARLMPIPGKQAGDPTNFDFSFFANSRVLALQTEPLQKPIAQAGLMPISSRTKREGTH